MSLDSIAVPSNFAGLRAVLRSMMPPDCVQRDGHPGPAATLGGADLYYEVIAGPREDEREAVRAWWGEFIAYAKERGGHEIVWRDGPPTMDVARDPATGKRGFTVQALLFIAKVEQPEVTW